MVTILDQLFVVGPRRQARARGVEPRGPDLEAGCSPRSTLVKALPGLATGKRLLFQFSVPVHVADKLRPAFEPHVVVGVNRLPRRTVWLAPERHAGLARRAVGLALVARHAGQYAVRPARHATLSARHDVVDRELASVGLRAAVLADVMVALID